LGYLPRPSEKNLIPSRTKAKRIPHRDAINHLLIITNNPNAADFSHWPSRRVENDPVPAFALGPIERHVGTFDEALRRVGLTFIQRHTCRNRNR